MILMVVLGGIYFILSKTLTKINLNGNKVFKYCVK